MKLTIIFSSVLSLFVSSLTVKTCLAEGAAPEQLSEAGEQQLAQIRQEFLGQGSIAYRVTTLRPNTPMEVEDSANRKIELVNLPATGMGRYIYYPTKEGALLLDGSSISLVDTQGRLNPLTPQLNLIGSEKTYNFQNGVLGPVLALIYEDGKSNSGDPYGFRTGDHLRSDILTHSRLVLNRSASDSIPVFEIYFKFNKSRKEYEPRLVQGFDLNELTNLRMNGINCGLKALNTSLSRSLACNIGDDVLVPSDTNNTIDIFKKGKLLATLSLGAKCGPEFKNSKRMYFGIHAKRLRADVDFYEEAIKGDSEAGSTGTQKRCENFGGCYSEKLSRKTADFFVNLEGASVSLTVSQMFCQLKDSDLNRIPKPIIKIDGNPDSAFNVIEFAGFAGIDSRLRCLSDLECHLRPKLFKISGNISGLKGSLRIDLKPTSYRLSQRAQALSLKVNGPLTFKTLMPAGSKFKILLSGAPKNQICTVANSERVMPENQDLTDIAISCVNK